MPLSHVSLHVADLDASLSFYLAALAPLGYKLYARGDGYAGLAVRAPDFWLHCVSRENRAAGPSSPVHVAFEGSSHAAVQKFYEAALKAGATCNGPPGYRPQYVAGYYGAYVLDPDGHNIECMHWSPWWLRLLNGAPMIFAGAAGAGIAWWFARG